MFSQDSHCLGEITSDLHSCAIIVSDGNAWPLAQEFKSSSALFPVSAFARLSAAGLATLTSFFCC